MTLISFAAAFGLNLLLIPWVKRFSARVGKVVQPREDRWHRKPTATLGGIGIFLAFVLALLLSTALNNAWDQVRWGILLGALVVFSVGLIDDFKRISPQAKLVGQILAATLVISLGFTSTFFDPRIENKILAQLPNIVLTFFWLVGISNAINLLDNMDGLAGGISLITAAILSYFFWRAGDLGMLIISLSLVGSILGFLVYNFPPASIFMGDSGSLFLGFTLALLAIARQQQASNVFAVLGVPTLLFLLPILDTTLVTFTRLLRGQSPAQGGRDHTSHRLIAFGLSERQALLTLYVVALLAGVMAAALESIRYWFSLVLVPLLIISLALLTAYLGGLKVVTATSAAVRSRPLVRIMLELTFRRRLLEIILDFFLIGLAYYLAFLVGFSLRMNESRLDLYLRTLPLALGGVYLLLFILGAYRGVWRYVDLGDLGRYFQVGVGGMIWIAAIIYFLEHFHLMTLPETFPPLIFLLFGLFLFLGLAASRSSFRIMDHFAQKRIQPDEERVIIYGAGDAGEMAARWILMNSPLNLHPVGFIDDDPFMIGRQIHGVEVLGGPEQLEAILEKHQVVGLILAVDDPQSEPVCQAIETCRRRGCWVRSLRLEFEQVL
ncbi:MAG: hypothetical protein JXB15_02115 [Anaerolineales bacterium]|nr:hypothetical protein [Anaerolineales bacterium]